MGSTSHGGEQNERGSEPSNWGDLTQETAYPTQLNKVTTKSSHHKSKRRPFLLAALGARGSETGAPAAGGCPCLSSECSSCIVLPPYAVWTSCKKTLLAYLAHFQRSWHQGQDSNIAGKSIAALFHR